MGLAIITNAGRAYIAAKQAAAQPAVLSDVVFALVPALDTTATPPATAVLPIAGQIVYTCPVTRAGYVASDQVVYSVLLGSDVGDFSYNWIGLKNNVGELCAVVYVPQTQKLKYNSAINQIGNNLTRNFLLQYAGLQGITQVTVAAATWQIDFRARLDASDTMMEGSMRALVGDIWLFLGNALKIESASGFKLRMGRALVGGRIVEMSADMDATAAGAVAGKDIWLDIARTGDSSGVSAKITIIADLPAAVRSSYTDSNGVYRSLRKVASISAGGVITDLRSAAGTVLSTTDILASLALQTGDYAGLRARLTTKTDVGLSNIPNAISSLTTLNDSNTLATSKAVFDAAAAQTTAVTAHVNRTDNPHATTKAQVGLGNLPNAKSDAINLNDTNTLATSKAVNDAVANCAAGDAAVSGALNAHAARADNPHATTKAQVGLSNLPNATSNDPNNGDPNSLATNAAVYALLQYIFARQTEDVGIVVWFPSRAAANASSAAYVPADGQLVARAALPRLWGKQASLPMTTDTLWIGLLYLRGSYSSGDGTSTFRLPDYNGKTSGDVALFLRGDGGNAASTGSVQLSQNLAHSHDVTNYAGVNSSALRIQSNTGAGQSGTQTSIEGGTESRPQNVAGVWCIKI